MPIAPYNGPQYQYMGPNAYGPYPTVPMQPTFQAPQPQTQPQPPIQTTTLPGRVIKPNETVTPQEVPMDGTASVFPVSDWSAVYVKTWRSYPRTTRGNRRGEWRQNRNSDGEYMEGGVMQHTDMMGMRDMHDMTPDEQLNHVKADVNMMWENASTDQRKRIKENLLKLVNSMSV